MENINEINKSRLQMALGKKISQWYLVDKIRSVNQGQGKEYFKNWSIFVV